MKIDWNNRDEVREYDREYRKKNAEKLRKYHREYARKYRLDNPKSYVSTPESRAYFRDKQAEYRVTKADRLRELRRQSARRHRDTQKRWLQKKLQEDPDYVKRIKKRYIAANPGLYAYHANKRRVRKLNSGGTHTLLEWEALKADHMNTCVMCWRREPEIQLTRDHITPLSRGGSDHISNIQPLCRHCNQVKHAKIINIPNTCQIPIFG